MIKDFWLKFGCFLTGYNYTILKNSSEASAKSVKKYTSAILIVSILWGFIGYMFSIRYIKTDFIGAISISLVMIFIVIQIERQIILTVGRKNTLAKIFRVAIAFVMAIIGSVIIDQTIFKEDIEKKKVSEIQEDVNSILPAKTEQLDVEIANLDTLILIKELERSDIINEVTARPFIKGSIS